MSSSGSASSFGVPLLNGTNYNEWSIAMTAYLRFQGSWTVISRNVTRPGPPASAAEMEAWDTLNDKALGAITLRLPASLKHYT